MKAFITVGKIAGYIFYALVFVVTVAVILATLLGNKNRNGITVGPFSLFTVLTGSMSPTFDAGSIIITQKTDAHKLQTGDILTYMPLEDNILVTHRIVKVINDGNGYSYKTKGDANNVDDMTPVAYEDTVGRVIFWANGVGAALLYIRTPNGIMVTAIFVLALVFISFLFDRLKRSVPDSKNLSGLR